MIYVARPPLKPPTAIDTRPPPPYITCTVLRDESGYTLHTTFTGHGCPSMQVVDEHAATRKELRKYVPKGMTYLKREANDAKDVVGTWQ